MGGDRPLGRQSRQSGRVLGVARAPSRERQSCCFSATARRRGRSVGERACARERRARFFVAHVGNVNVLRAKKSKQRKHNEAYPHTTRCARCSRVTHALPPRMLPLLLLLAPRSKCRRVCVCVCDALCACVRVR